MDLYSPIHMLPVALFIFFPMIQFQPAAPHVKDKYTFLKKFLINMKVQGLFHTPPTLLNIWLFLYYDVMLISGTRSAL